MKWEDIEIIVRELEDHYPDEDLSEVTIAYLKEMITSLSEFEDHDIDPSKQQLKQILEAWADLRNEMNEL